MKPLLEIENLTGGYGDTNVVFEVSAGLLEGQTLGVFGRNGVGKTTLARLIHGSLQPARGTILLSGKRIEHLPAFRRRWSGIGYMPQTGMVFDDLTVRDNLGLPTARDRPERYLDRFPILGGRPDQLAGTLSGGERKILAFVRTMMEDTRLLILDEPSEGVQPENIELMIECLEERIRDGTGIVLIEQNVWFLERVADIYMGLESGRESLSAKSTDVTADQIRSMLRI